MFLEGYGQTLFTYHGIGIDEKLPLVVFVHGFLSNSNDSFQCLYKEYLKRKPLKYRWLMYDLFGTGNSSTLKTLNYDLETYHLQLKSLIEHVQVETNSDGSDVILVGHSMGGVISGTFVKDYKVQGLVLLTPGGIPTHLKHLVNNPMHILAKMIHLAGSNWLTRKIAVRASLFLSLGLSRALEIGPIRSIARLLLAEKSHLVLTDFLQCLERDYCGEFGHDRLLVVDSQLSNIPMINFNQDVFDHLRYWPNDLSLKLVFGTNDIISPAVAGKDWHSNVAPRSDLITLDNATHHLASSHQNEILLILDEMCK